MSEKKRYGWNSDVDCFVDLLLEDKYGYQRQLRPEKVLEILNSRAAFEAKLEALERIRIAAVEIGAYFRYGPLLDALAAAQQEQEDE